MPSVPIDAAGAKKLNFTRQGMVKLNVFRQFLALVINKEINNIGAANFLWLKLSK